VHFRIGVNFFAIVGAHGKREPITEIWGRRPQRCPEAKPIVRGSGAKPPEAASILASQKFKRGANLSTFYPVELLKYIFKKTTVTFLSF